MKKIVITEKIGTEWIILIRIHLIDDLNEIQPYLDLEKKEIKTRYEKKLIIKKKNN